MTTITASSTLGLYLSSPGYTNPVVIQAGVSISGPADAISSAPSPWSIDNFGTIAATNTAIALSKGGSVTNAASGSITSTPGASANGAGIAVNGGAGTVVNYGVISALSGTSAASGSVFGVFLNSGGLVTNAAYASIAGGGVSSLYYGGVEANANATVVNSGSIAGLGSFAVGVLFRLGGSVTNAISASITGGVGAVNIGTSSTASVGTVINAGTLAEMNNSGGGCVNLYGGGYVTNLGSGLITGDGFGIDISSGGTVINAGTVTGQDGAVFIDGSGYFANASTGSISVPQQPAGIGVLFGGIGTVVNNGIIGDLTIEVNLYNGIGVDLEAGGTITNAASARIFGDYDGVNVGGRYAPGPSTVSNYGTIGAGEVGVLVEAGGSVTNASGGTINGRSGVVGTFSQPFSASAAITLVNAGSIAGDTSSGNGVQLAAGGAVTNQIGGMITGYRGIGAFSPAYHGIDTYGSATIVNLGDIAGGTQKGVGVYLPGGGAVTNAASAAITGGTDGVSTGRPTYGGAGTVINDGSIAGGIGVDLIGGGSLTNVGAIVGNSGTAVVLDGTGSNLLALEPGFSFSGLIQGSSSASNILELASGSSGGTVNGLGSEFSNFGSIVFDPMAAWRASGSSAGLAGGQTISGFAQGDTIELTGVTASYVGFGGGALTLTGGVELLFEGAFKGEHFVVDPNGGNTDISVACFAKGTRIETAVGEVPVEELRVGDYVAARHGRRFATIIWLGHRHIDCRPYRRPADVWPVRVRAGAFGDGSPVRDLLLSPDHAVFADGTLVPVRHLINGSTIAQEQVNEITYYHVELATHDVILAEGLPCESYLDTGNSAAFAGGETVSASAISVVS